MFTDEHLAFRAMVREFVEKEINPHVDQWERDEEMPLHEVFGKMGDLGMFGLEMDPAYGGQGADHLFTLVLAEEMGRADHGSIGMAVGVQVDMATPSLAQYGSHELKEQYLAPALRGEMVTSIAVTEPDAGSDVAALRTNAVKDGEEWVINGSKIYITNSLQADWLCLLARTSDEGGHRGMSQIIVPTDVNGFEATKLDKLGMRASDTGILTFTDVRVPVSNTIGEEGRGFQQQMEQFVLERVWANYSSVSGMQLALERTAEYLKQRVVRGKPLMANDFIRFKLAELASEVEALNQVNHGTARTILEGGDPTRLATIGKIKSGNVGREIAYWCLQFHGGSGYMEDNWTARFLRDNRVAPIGGGSTETMLEYLSRLDGFTA
ncbi:MAG: acyl-CoA dehydrogenase family protein [Acidimicrobiia bacterium]|nr:MAG: acyl-CoA dehydrogenase family protein [Acidimicrobiia bacterium]